MEYGIQIKQRGGKWVAYCVRFTLDDIQKVWTTIPTLRRKARCVKIENGLRKVIAKYDPP
jgi:hypothetical protein